MPPNILDTVAPRAEPIPKGIAAANSKERLESREFPIVEKQLNQNVDEILLHNTKQDTNEWFRFKTELIWPNIIGITLLHAGTVYALLTFSIFEYKMLTLWGLITGGIGGFGVTGGVHRLWTHRSFKAKLPLRVILLFSYLVAGENSVFNWVRDHRIHHKFSETDADPHNSNRGFFFSHVGWLMMKKHPEVLRRGRQVDMSDITSDPLLQFAEKHFTILKLLCCFVMPIMVPIYCWNEEWYMTVITQLFIRYPFTLNATWSVNSFAHFWGNHSYDKNIRPAENRLVAFASMGEGWHNYHHSFPWDYKAAELGNYELNLTTMMLDGFAKIGWAYDLKEASNELVRKVTENRGDGSHPTWGKDEQ